MLMFWTHFAELLVGGIGLGEKRLAAALHFIQTFFATSNGFEVVTDGLFVR